MKLDIISQRVYCSRHVFIRGFKELGISSNHLRSRHTQNIDERIKTAQEAIKEAGLDFSVKVNDACED
jgi:hypothetical protein